MVQHQITFLKIYNILALKMQVIYFFCVSVLLCYLSIIIPQRDYEEKTYLDNLINK